MLPIGNIYGGGDLPIVERSVEVKASPKTVWTLMASQEGLRQWFESDLEIDMRLGGAHRHYADEADQWIVGNVLDIVPEKSLVLSWFEENTDWVHPIRLTFALEAIPGGTRVTQRFDGFPGIGKPNWERTERAYQIGTDQHALLQHLKDVVESAHAA